MERGVVDTWSSVYVKAQQDDMSSQAVKVRSILKQWREDAFHLINGIQKILPSDALLVWRTSNLVHPHGKEVSMNFYRYALNIQTTDAENPSIVTPYAKDA